MKIVVLLISLVSCASSQTAKGFSQRALLMAIDEVGELEGKRRSVEIGAAQTNKENLLVTNVTVIDHDIGDDSIRSLQTRFQVHFNEKTDVLTLRKIEELYLCWRGKKQAAQFGPDLCL